MPELRYSTPDERDYTIAMAMEVAGDVDIPSSFEVWHPPVENQGSVGNCVAQAGAAYMECIDHRDGLPHENRSVGYIYFADASSSAGMQMRDACMILLKDGDVYRTVWERLDRDKPEYYEERRALGRDITDQAKCIGAFIRLNTFEEAKLFMLKYQLPWFMAGDVETFISAFAGKGGHAVLGFGWDDNAKKNGKKGCIHYLNSWGTSNMFVDKEGTAWCDFDKLREVWGFIPVEMIKFPDVESGRWSEAAITKAAEDGIIIGYEDGTFRPDRQLTREEMAAIYQRIMVQVDKRISEANPILG